MYTKLFERALGNNCHSTKSPHTRGFSFCVQSAPPLRTEQCAGSRNFKRRTFRSLHSNQKTCGTTSGRIQIVLQRTLRGVVKCPDERILPLLQLLLVTEQREVQEVHFEDLGVWAPQGRIVCVPLAARTVSSRPELSTKEQLMKTLIVLGI